MIHNWAAVFRGKCACRMEQKNGRYRFSTLIFTVPILEVSGFAIDLNSTQTMVFTAPTLGFEPSVYSTWCFKH